MPNWNQLAWWAGLFLLTFVLSLAVVGFVLVILPPTYFLDSYARGFMANRPWYVRWLALGLKNLLGVALVIVGIALSLPAIPGQGLLTILVGLILLDFPGKRRLERLIVGRPRILRAINAWRARFHRQPFVLAEQSPGSSMTRAVP